MVSKRFCLGLSAMIVGFTLVLAGYPDPASKIEYVEVPVEVKVPGGGMSTQNVERQETLPAALNWVQSNYKDFFNYVIDLKDYDEVSYIVPSTLRTYP